MIMVEIATIAATWKAHLPRNPGTTRMCRTNAYTITETKAQVSFGSQLQYLPHDSFAQIPPRKVPTVRAYKPMVSDISETRSEEHTSELQSRENLVCRLLLEKKKQKAD